MLDFLLYCSSHYRLYAQFQEEVFEYMDLFQTNRILHTYYYIFQINIFYVSRNINKSFSFNAVYFSGFPLSYIFFIYIIMFTFR